MPCVAGNGYEYATNHVDWTKADAHAWAASRSPAGLLAADVLEGRLNSWSVDSVYIWDLVAAVNTSDARVCPAVPLAVDIDVTPGPEQGRMLITDGPANAIVCFNPDPGQIKAQAADTLGKWSTNINC